MHFESYARRAASVQPKERHGVSKHRMDGWHVGALGKGEREM